MGFNPIERLKKQMEDTVNQRIGILEPKLNEMNHHLSAIEQSQKNIEQLLKNIEKKMKGP